MATAPVVEKENSFESVFTDIAKIFQGTLNAAVNLARQNSRLYNRFCRRKSAAIYGSGPRLPSRCLAAMKPRCRIGESTVPYAEKVAKLVALWGPKSLSFWRRLA